MATYLSQEGFVENRGTWYSRELNVTIKVTHNKSLYDVVADEHTYKNISKNSMKEVVDACHQYQGTQLLVILYNLQFDVIAGHMLKIKEDI